MVKQCLILLLCIFGGVVFMTCLALGGATLFVGGHRMRPLSLWPHVALCGQVSGAALGAVVFFFGKRRR